MKRAMVLVFLIAFLIAGTGVCSQEPPPPPTEGQPWIFNPKAGAQRDIKPKYGYDITVNTISPPDKMKAGKTNDPAEDDKNKNNDGKPPATKDDPIVGYTLWLMVFTGCLAVCNIALWIYTKKSANALPAIERAYVFVNMNGEVRIFTGGISGEPRHRSFHVPLNLFNAGKTPAILKKIYADIIITRENPTKESTADITVEIPFDEMRGDTDRREIRSGEPWKAELTITKAVGDFTEFFETNLVYVPSYPFRIFCYGKVIYKDMFKKDQTTWFCWEYSRSNFFTRADNDEMNDYT